MGVLAAALRRLRSAAAALALLALAACSLGPSVAQHAIDYNESISSAANALLVRNVLRARDHAPMHFSSLPQVRGSISFGLDNPNIFFPVAPGIGTQNGAGLGLTALSAPSFDVATLDTQEFTRGILEPIAPEVLAYFATRHYPTGLLPLLFFSVVEVPGVEGTALNDPRCWFERPDCPDPAAGRRFAEILETTLNNPRLTINTYDSLTPVGPRLTAAQAAQPTLLTQLSGATLRLRAHPDGGFQLYRTVRAVAICESGQSLTRVVAARRRGAVPDAEADAACTRQEVPVPTDPLTAARERSGARLRLETRSVEEILRYLGALLRVQEEDAASAAPRGCLTVHADGPRGEPRRRACLFTLPRASQMPPDRSVAFTIEHEGVRYAVPANAEPGPEAGGDRGDYTLRVLALVSQLINLQKSASSLPTTRAVQLVR